MKNEKKNKKYIKYDYIINEMIIDINKSIENITKISNEQQELIDYLEKSNNEKFNPIINELKAVNKQYKEQINVLTHRLECINAIKELADTIITNYVLSMLLEAFGIVNKEGKSIEEREENKEETSDIDCKYFA